MTNHITLSGNVTRDPELRFTTTGQGRTVITLATNRRFQAKGAAEPTEITAFFSVVAWGSLAEHSAESLKKGDRITITGRVDQRTWVDENGQPHSSFDVVADEVAVSLKFRTVVVDRTRREPAAQSSLGTAQHESPHEPEGPNEPAEPDDGSGLVLTDPNASEYELVDA